jgi:DNA repair protein SbcC/Rad50
MILKKIYLENIRSYEKQEVEFPEGSTLLSGDIGSGKTSILLAIEFALFGLQPGQRGSSLLRNGATEGKIKIEFQIEDKLIEIERTLKKSKTISQDYAAITIDNQKQELSVTELKNRVLELLNYPKEFSKKQNILYKFTVYTPQEEMKQIILQDSETRTNTLRHVFGIDKYKRILENSSTIISKIREEKRIKEALIFHLEQDKEFTTLKEKETEDKKYLLLEIGKELEETKHKRQEKENEKNEIQKKIDEIRNLEQEIEKTKLMISNKNISISDNSKTATQLIEQISEVEKIEFDEKDIENLENKLKQEKINLERISNKINEKRNLEQEIEKTNFLISTKNEIIQGNKKIIEGFEEQIKEIRKLEFEENKIFVIEQKIEKTKLQKKELEEHNIHITGKMHSLNLKIQENGSLKNKLTQIEVCPTCLQDVNTNHKEKVIENINLNDSKNSSEIQELNKEKILILEKISLLEKDISDKQKKIEEHKKSKEKFKEAEEKQKRIQELEKSTENIEKDISILMETQKNLKKQTFELKEIEDLFKLKQKEIEEQIKKIHELNILKIKLQGLKEKQLRVNEIEKTNSMLKKDSEILNSQVDSLKNIIFDLSKFENIFQIKQIEFEEIFKQERNLEIKIAELKKEIDVFSIQIQELKEKIQKGEEIQNQMQHLNDLEEWILKKFIPVMSHVEKNVMVKLKQEFSRLFAEWFSMLVSESFNIQLKDDFTPIIEHQDYEIDYNYLSGGERTAIALAYRLALNQVINSLISKIKTKDLVILDEPTDGFSEAQLDKMREVLEQLDVAQLIIVSHEQKIEGFVDNVIRFKKNNGISYKEE